MLRNVAKRYGLKCLLHEKPFAGVNGSGKHLNYSIGNAELGTLFDPGETPHANAKFLVFCAAMMLDPQEFGIASCSVDDLAVSGKEQAVAVLNDILNGQGPRAMRRARSAFKLPLALGFGLREPSQLEALSPDAQPDAVVFGSALLKHIDAGNSAAEFMGRWK